MHGDLQGSSKRKVDLDSVDSIKNNMESPRDNQINLQNSNG